MSQSTDSLETGGQLTDDMQEVEVLVRDAKRKKVTTIVQMVTTMIDATSSFYQRLYDIKVDEEIRLVFRFVRSVSELQQEEDDVWEGVIELILKHEHPYLVRDSWLATNTHMENTILKGTNVLFVVGRRTENQ
jgi:hypothetical protein